MNVELQTISVFVYFVCFSFHDISTKIKISSDVIRSLYGEGDVIGLDSEDQSGNQVALHCRCGRSYDSEKQMITTTLMWMNWT